MSKSIVPEKYQPDGPEIPKADLYRDYWGEDLLPTRAVADKHNVDRNKVNVLFDRLGIPKRPGRFSRGNSVSPFVGFYNPGESVPGDDSGGFDPDVEREDWSDHVDWQDHYVGERGESDE